MHEFRHISIVVYSNPLGFQAPVRFLKQFFELRNTMLIVLPKMNLLGLTQDLFEVGLQPVHVGISQVAMFINRLLQAPRPMPILIIIYRKEYFLVFGVFELSGDKFSRVVHGLLPLHTAVISDLSLLV